MYIASSVDGPNRWTSRVIPVILFALIGIATYVVTKRICLDVLIPNNQHGSAVAILVLLYIFMIIAVVCYVRTIYTVLFNAGVVPLPTRTLEISQHAPKEGYRYDASSLTEQGRRDAADNMEQFWMRDAFQCTEDGLPRWCSKCRNWKPDRSHHSKELARCVRKLDHFCPWMGGVIAETSFKFFIQFNMYASFFCAICLGSSAYVVAKQRSDGSALDIWVIVILALGAFFGIFTLTLGTNSMRYAYLNTTTIDSIDAATNTYFLAIRVSRNVPPSDKYRLVTFPTADASITKGGSIHTFAIVKTNEGENPWDLGYYRNWCSIMGESLLDWLLPLRLSPEVMYDSPVSDYPLGKVYREIRVRYGLSSNEERPRRKRSRRRRREDKK